jgi:hypothetical protein
MLNSRELKKSIFAIDNEAQFNKVALELFHLHVNKNELYRSFVIELPETFQNPSHFSEIPFLPISFFKTKKILLEGEESKTVFTSSGTTGSTNSRHFVVDEDWYLENSLEIFRRFYGPIEELCVLALLPSYLEREGSSLIVMAKALIEQSRHEASGFYLHNFSELNDKLQELKKAGQKTLLLGVSFGLLDFGEQYTCDFPELIVMETGGMKGRRKEMIREELHEILKKTFKVPLIHSEYGMTELFSQAYALRAGLFQTPPWMKILIRDSNDPFSYLSENEVGGMNIIDLANFYSCPFIATQDLGRKNTDGVEILGRFDNSDIRGCNLLYI